MVWLVLLNQVQNTLKKQVDEQVVANSRKEVELNDQDKEALWCIAERNGIKEIRTMLDIYRDAANYNDPFDYYMNSPVVPLKRTSPDWLLTRDSVQDSITRARQAQQNYEQTHDVQMEIPNQEKRD